MSLRIFACCHLIAFLVPMVGCSGDKPTAGDGDATADVAESQVGEDGDSSSESAAASEDAVAKQNAAALKELQGEWKKVSHVYGDKDKMAESPDPWRFEGDHVDTGGGGEATVSVRTDYDPKQIDLTNSGLVLKGIYKIEGDTLTICHTHVGGIRPTSFVAKEDGDENVLIVLERSKGE